MHLAAVVAAALMAVVPSTAIAAHLRPITIPGDPPLPAYWQPAPEQAVSASSQRAAPAPPPAIVLLHGCGGLMHKRELSSRYTEYAARFNAAGYSVLIPDSFGARGSGSICTQRSADRTVKIRDRRADVLRVVSWLAAQPDVDRSRIALVGWSNGGSTLLASIDRTKWTDATPVAAIALYPSCTVPLKSGAFDPTVPLLMLLGEKDDWTPPAPCLALVDAVRARRPSARIDAIGYPDSVHGFDGAAPVRFRADISSGVNPAGVHVGGNPRARSAALAEIDAFLGRALGIPKQ